jgi:3-deoxy-7-phosphoheptulonate synthase
MIISPLSTWLTSSDSPPVISGPCSAETEKQVIDTAVEVAKIKNVAVFRAGLWKPRTKPNSFEGVGTKGLQWLIKVKAVTGLKTTVEVAHPDHIRACLDAGIDMLWVGARTVTNPFSIQEISNVLKNVDIPVLIKNPVAPDIKTWIGALERINSAGIDKLAAVHRGFYDYQESIYRNSPMWEIPIELKRLFPELPLICDPSHICGNKSLIRGIAQDALDLEMDGLMIETHISPENALTDANQQLNPQELEDLISNLIIKKRVGGRDFENQLEDLRSEIDKIDSDLLRLLSKRMKTVQKIGKYKTEHQITILQLKRWNKVIQNRLEKGKELGLDKEFLKKMLCLIHEKSIEIQGEANERE